MQIFKLRYHMCTMLYKVYLNGHIFHLIKFWIDRSRVHCTLRYNKTSANSTIFGLFSVSVVDMIMQTYSNLAVMIKECSDCRPALSRMHNFIQLIFIISKWNRNSIRGATDEPLKLISSSLVRWGNC